MREAQANTREQDVGTRDNGTSVIELREFEIIFGREAQTHVGFNVYAPNCNPNVYVSIFTFEESISPRTK